MIHLQSLTLQFTIFLQTRKKQHKEFSKQIISSFNLKLIFIIWNGWKTEYLNFDSKSFWKDQAFELSENKEYFLLPS